MEPFTVVLNLGTCPETGNLTYRTLASFQTYREAARVCRKLLVRYYRGLLPYRAEVTRISPGHFWNLDQPSVYNHGEERFDSGGYRIYYKSLYK